MAQLLVSAAGWGLAILLLTWVSAGASLGRSLLAILTWWRCLLTVALWRCAGWSTVSLGRMLTRGSTVTLGWLLSIALRRLLAIALGWLLAVTWRRCAILAGWCAVAARCRVALLVLRVVASINGTEKKLDDPKIGCKIDRRVCAHHLFLFVLEVGCAVNHRANLRVLIKPTEELPGSRVVSYLSKLEGDSATPVGGRLELSVGLLDDFKNLG